MCTLSLSLLAITALDASELDSRTGIRVSAPMAAGSAGDVLEMRISPDKRRVVYRGIRGSGGTIELYSVPLDGSASPVRISGTLATGRVVGGFRISPDAARVVYWADRNAVDVIELFSVPIDGSAAPVRISGTLVSGGDVAVPLGEPGVQITPDSSRVVYLADARANEVYELFSVPIEGGADPTRISHALAAGQDVGYFIFHGGWDLFRPGFQITPDGTRVLYLADQSGQNELYVAPIDGGMAPLRLSHELPPGTRIGSQAPHQTPGYHVSPDSSRVVYLANRAEELWSVPTDGGLAPVRLEQSERIEYDVQISADSSRVLYRAGVPYSSYQLHSAWIDGSAPPVVLHPPLGFPGIDKGFLLAADQAVYQHQESLFRVPIDGSAAPTLLTSSVPSTNADPLSTADATHVVYRSGGLFSVAGDGSAAPIALCPGTVNVLEFRLAADGSHVVYRADAENPGTIELFSVRVDGRLPPRKLNAALVPGGDVQSVSPTDAYADFEIAPDARHVVYLADQEALDVVHVHAVPIDGSRPPTRLSAPVGQPFVGGDVAHGQPSGSPFRFAPGGRVVYLADQDVDELQQLYTVVAPRSAPPGPALRLSGPLEFVLEFRLGAGGGRAVYRFHDDDPVAGYYTGLASVPIDGSAPPVVLHRALDARQQVRLFELAPDGSRVVYFVEQDESFAASSPAGSARSSEIAAGKSLGYWSVPLDGSAPPALLSEPGFASFGVFAISPDSTRVVFAASRDEYQRPGLWVAPIDGRTAPRRLSAAWDELRGFRVSPDSKHVVFAATLGAHDARLFSVPMDGGPGQLLYRSFLPYPGVWRFLPSPDSSRVVFSAGSPCELFSVPIDGSQPAVVLSGPLVPGGSVDLYPSFEISADGSRVVYRADQDVVGVFELFSAAVDGGAPAVKLNGALMPGADVTSFRSSPDGTRVVFQANGLRGLDLFSVPIAGSAVPVRLDPRGDSMEFRISNDGRRVAYLAPWAQPGAVELHDVGIEGGPVRQLNAPLISRGDVTGFELSDDGSRVLYRADQSQDEVFELYLSHPRPVVLRGR